MSTRLSEITGDEAYVGDGGPLDALVAFYRAFNSQDLGALAANWLDGERPSMDNPVGGIRRGWPAIGEGYRRLFEGPASVRVAFHDFTVETGEGWCLFVGREQGACTIAGTSIALRIRTTRWFVRHEGRWRQLHHHGSIEEPALLADYQRAIFGTTPVAPGMA
jgi:hypothetical protein